MKTIGQIQHKIKQVRFRYLKKFLEKCLSKTSTNCVYNRPSSFSENGVDNVCLCGFEMEERKWVGTPCDKRLDKRAKDCTKFEFLHTKEELKDEFQTTLDSLPIGAIASQFPDLAALLWVLDEDMEEDNG